MVTYKEYRQWIHVYNKDPSTTRTSRRVFISAQFVEYRCEADYSIRHQHQGRAFKCTSVPNLLSYRCGVDPSIQPTPTTSTTDTVPTHLDGVMRVLSAIAVQLFCRTSNSTASNKYREVHAALFDYVLVTAYL